ncbi:hypothetical protein CERSUDRAFT_100843 [Gelatoporia subvermispora B]|uniref:Uncharacterized protein n=1 Tax=Ceriporiopsis subvermispora (strain B) TaxID=914234 RepID=M2Q2B8_CERS8|nr:hypothetical protein CERSUDRAFT_100843 [Gelatoporia subvermispora B]
MPATRASNSEKHLGLPDKPRTWRSSAQVYFYFIKSAHLYTAYNVGTVAVPSAQVQADAAAKVAAAKQKMDEKAATLKRLAKMEDKKAKELEEKKKRVYTPAKTKQSKNQSVPGMEGTTSILTIFVYCNNFAVVRTLLGLLSCF